MLIFGKSELKFSITSNFVIIAVCKTFYFIDEIFFFIIDIFFVSVLFQTSIRLDSVGPALLKSSALSSESRKVVIH